MWFKQSLVFRLPTPWSMDLPTLEEKLSQHPFARCSGSELQSSGWVPPRPGGPMVFALNHQWLIALATEQRLLPASVINDELKERIEAVEEQQGYSPGRKQRKEMKEQIAAELLPRAFTRRRTTYVWIDPVNGWLVIDASAVNKGEEVIERLRRDLEELPVSLVRTQLSPTSAMSDWLAAGEAPAGFTIDRDCEMKALAEEQSSVRYVRHALDGERIAEQIKEHLASGKLPTRLALTWNDRISFVLTDKLEIKRLAFLDLIKENAEHTAENAEEQFDADFALMTGELAQFLPTLLEALCGETVPS